jgi:hypothetical protein
MSKSSVISRRDGVVTKVPTRGRISTSPSVCSCLSASRTGVRLTPNSSASASSERLTPVASSPARIRRRVSSMTRPWMLERFAVSAGLAIPPPSACVCSSHSSAFKAPPS